MVKKTGDEYTYAAAFWNPELGRHVSWHFPHCVVTQRVDKQFKARLDADGNLSIMSWFKGISYCEEYEKYTFMWTPLHTQARAYSIFICPHRAMITLLDDLFKAAFDPNGEDCSLTEGDTEEHVKPLLKCKFCDARVVKFHAKRWEGRGAYSYDVRTVRNLGKATDKADEVWFAQPLFSSEAEAMTRRRGVRGQVGG